MRSGEFSVNPVNLPYSRVVELSSHLMLFYTGMKRISSDVASSYARDFSSQETLLRTIREHVDQGVAIIASGSDISNFGELLHEAWRKKRELSDMVSSPDIDSIYEKVRSAGAIGGKLLGAGGGGFFLVFAPPSTHQRIRKELRGFVSVPFEMEKTGSQIIFSNRE
ncbi:MAG: hypothetical protein P1U81_07770 [Verrucomicrobiales bacterium]|nr:hypothetical protein [Verrucomicrobiales bacterium]